MPALTSLSKEEICDRLIEKIKKLDKLISGLLEACEAQQELLDQSDVRYFISNNLGEQAALHSAIFKARTAIKKTKGD